MNIRSATSHVESPPQGEWYLVQCKSRQDYRAEENLIRQGFVCVRPVCQRDRVVRGRREFVQESLFPGYLFINLPASGSWSSVRSTRGVVRLVSFGGTPLSVCPDLVAQLQERVNPSLCVSFSSGDRVKLLDDGFAELDAVFLTMDGDERAILLINFLNRQQQVCLPLAKISAL
ncbi:MAG: transcription/translation regulatory transformer protein RfaH [Pyrinomonadaceae bacterium]|uniref:transcription/translation regulatory transformer protein RfaH n=1 Tax=Pseudomonas sp. TaxID=306 RepID=UPI003D6DC577